MRGAGPLSPEGQRPSPWGEPVPPDSMPAEPASTNGSTTNGSGRVELAGWNWSPEPGYSAGQAGGAHRVLRGLRSALALATIALALAVAVAATASLLIWAIAAAIHHAAAN